MMGSLHGGTSFQKGLGAVHALSHPIGSRYHTHHGMTNAVLLPYVLRHNERAIADKMARVAQACGLAPEFSAIYDALLQLRASAGVPHTLAAFDPRIAFDDQLVAAALADPTAGGNPVPLDAATVRKIAADATAGTV
jgi:alcohol dehydrogenase class IV